MNSCHAFLRASSLHIHCWQLCPVTAMPRLRAFSLTRHFVFLSLTPVSQNSVSCPMPFSANLLKDPQGFTLNARNALKTYSFLSTRGSSRAVLCTSQMYPRAQCWALWPGLLGGAAASSCHQSCTMCTQHPAC